MIRSKRFPLFFGISIAGLVLTLAAAILLLGRGVPALAYGNGDGTSNTGTTIGTPIPLAETFSSTLNGDYVSAGVGMRGTGPPGGGTIALPALPIGSTVENAFLYWAVMNDTTIPSLAAGNINGNPITGSLIGKTANPCWSGDIHNYVADVTSDVLPGANNVLTGFASGGLPIVTQPLLEGASIVLVYSEPSLPLRTVIIHEGAVTFAAPPSETTTFTGFVAAAGTSQTTYIMADGQPGLRNKTLVDGTETADFTLDGSSVPGGPYWDDLTQDISAFVPQGDTDVTVEALSENFGGYDCLTWVAQVLSVPAPAPPEGGGGPPVVGGTLGLLSGTDSPVLSATSTTARDYAVPIAAAGAGAVVALAAGGWFTRRRWLR